MSGVNTTGDNHVARFFDEYAEKEWQRNDSDLVGRIAWAIHMQFTLKHIDRGDRVLDAGSGPGRGALAMFERGANVTLADISRVQLDLAKQKIADSTFLADGFVLASVTDLAFESDSFDVVVCIGGALSYVQHGYEAALKELVRVLRPGGRLIVGAMSLYGQLRVFPAGDSADILASFDQHIDRGALFANTGRMVTQPDSYVIHMPLFLCTTRYLSDNLSGLGCATIGAATSNPLSADGMQLEKVTADPIAERNLIELEVSLSERPEYLDTGEWVLVAAEKNSRRN